MSKLSAVRTGQATQGLGTAPAVSQRLVIGSAVDLGDTLPTVAVNPRSAHSAAAATLAAAWLSLSATELEVRDYFRHVPVHSGLEQLAKMRHQCNLAAETLQGRIDLSQTERCTGCNKTLEEARKSQWIMQGSDVDSDTGVPVPYRFCGPMCVRERNRERMMPKDAPRLRFDGQPEGDVR